MIAPRVDATEPSAPKVLEDLIRRAEAGGASDIHLQMVNGIVQVAFRLDGVMTPGIDLAEDVAGRVLGRIKFLAKLKTYQESLPQDGRIEKADVGARSDIRVSTYPTVTGEKVVLRLFSNSDAKPLEELGYPATARKELECFLHQTSGLLLLTGPAGCGKTTTIYSCLRHLAGRGGRHIITVEDPVEQIIPGVMQTEVNEAIGLSFAKAARHLLRQDPQVLVIGEIRDEETANIAIRASLTGHLVITTLHAGSCQGVFERLFVMCEDLPSVISGVDLVLNQRLIRRLCEACRGGGCERCFSTGYHGRLPLAEWVKIDPPLRARIRQEGSVAIVPQMSMEMSAGEVMKQQLTDEAEFKRVLGR